MRVTDQKSSTHVVVAASPSRLRALLTSRNAAFLLLLIAPIAGFWQPLSTVIVRSLEYIEYEHYSHIVLIPLVTVCLLYLGRAAIFAHVEYAPGTGTSVLAAGIALGWLSRSGFLALDRETHLTLATLSAVTLVGGGFLFCYGARAFKAASFGLSLLLLVVPLPPAVLAGIIQSLQAASAEASYLLFTLLDVPILREGFVFALPGLTIEVAEECSGIRSSLALFITGLLVAHFRLRSAWTRTALVLAIVPLAVIKNAIRIVTLSLLAVYVDRGFITGSLHRQGGIVFFLAALVLMAGVAWGLGKLEARFGHGGREKELVADPAP